MSVCDTEPVDVTQPQVSLSVSKTSSPKPYAAGQPLTYTIVVTNGGPDAAAPAAVSDPFPAPLARFTWTGTASAGSSCRAPSGRVPLHDTPIILAGGSVTYTLTGTVPAGSTGDLMNTVKVDPPPGVADPVCTPNCTAIDQNSPQAPPPPAPPAPIAPITNIILPVTG